LSAISCASVRVSESANPSTVYCSVICFSKTIAGYKVLFTTVHKMLTQLRESQSERTLRQMEAKFEKYDLVICDEFGYISFDKQGSELLFNHLSLRTGRKSTIITTNLSFDRWQEIFGDPVLTAALVDRLTHKAYLINMNGESYRLR